MIFINFSNHPSEQWSREQRAAAESFGEIVDVSFPPVPADMNEEGVAALADRSVEKIFAAANETVPAAVMCQGEFTLAFAVAKRLREKAVPVMAACSERTAEVKDGVKTSVFCFRRFRRYE